MAGDFEDFIPLKQCDNSRTQSSPIAPVAFFSPLGKTLLSIESIVEKHSTKPSLWQKELLAEGIWLRDKNSPVELTLSEPIKGLTVKVEPEIPGVSRTDNNTDGKRIELTFQRPGVFEIVATLDDDANPKKISISIAPPGQRGTIIRVPDSASAPYAPDLTNTQLGSSYPWEPFLTGEFSTFLTAKVSQEARVVSPTNDVI